LNFNNIITFYVQLNCHVGISTLLHNLNETINKVTRKVTPQYGPIVEHKLDNTIQLNCSV